MSAFSQAAFVTSVAKLDQLPVEGAPEIAFVGRSNVGKSSAINALCWRRRLAFVSKTPGRTQTINFFDLGTLGRLVDLPGYGHARVPRAIRAQWDALVGGYFKQRRSLVAVVVIMDARHPLARHDETMLEWIAPLHVQRLVLLAKSDKLTRSERTSALNAVRGRLADRVPRAEVGLFSSLTGEGVDETRALLERWLREAPAQP